MLEPKGFRKQMYCIEESTCDIVRAFSARGIVPPCPLVTPLPGWGGNVGSVNFFRP